jgi:CheY-like chemotaxis protein
MGLSAAFGIIKNHKGAIDVYSEIGRGSTFNIYLPVIKEKGRARKEEIKAEPPAEVQGHILLVEEDDILREMTSLLLQGIGYTVTECKNGAEAIEIYKDIFKEIDIVYLDMALTEMNAKEALSTMREINPSVKALFSSSFSLTDEIVELVHEKRIVGFVQKPFKINELSGVIEEAMKR